MTQEKFHCSLSIAIDYFTQLAENQIQATTDDNERLILSSFKQRLVDLQRQMDNEYDFAILNQNTNAIYLENFLTKLTNLMNITKETNDLEKINPSIRELINFLPPPSTTSTESSESTCFCTAGSIAGAVIGFIAGFVIGVPVGIIAGAVIGGVPLLVLGDIFGPLLSIIYFGICGLVGGLVLGVAGAQSLFESCGGVVIPHMPSPTNPLSDLTKQVKKTLDATIFCRLFASKSMVQKDETRHAEISPSGSKLQPV